MNDKALGWEIIRTLLLILKSDARDHCISADFQYYYWTMEILNFRVLCNLSKLIAKL